MKNLTYLLFLMLAVGVCFTSCEEDTPDVSNEKLHIIEPGADVQTTVQELLITMADGDTMQFTAGTFNFTSTLSIDGKDGIVIRGAGEENTILDFSGQTAGAEGIKGTDLTWFLIHDLTIQNTEGDAIKIKDSDGLTFYNVTINWVGTPGPDNGAYGLYPVTCSNILIDNCYVRGASDAGIYVGQSQHVIVSNSTAEFNVAGIEIENTSNADVFNCLATNNTGGILVFDLPGLPVANGSSNRIFDNEVIENDYPNFAPAGNIVGQVPNGTGILLMAAKECEVFNNTITNNNAVGTAAVSIKIVEDVPDTLEYYPYCRNVYVHDNTYSRENVFPSQQNFDGELIELGALINVLFLDGDAPDLLFDGIVDPEESVQQICFSSNNNADFANIDFPGDFLNVSGDITPHECTRDPLPAAEVDAPAIP